MSDRNQGPKEPDSTQPPIDEEVLLPDNPTEDEIKQVVDSLLGAGRANFPLKIDGEPLSPDDPHRDFTHVKLGTEDFVRMWMAALLQRTLDGYEATLILREIGLDVDARATSVLPSSICVPSAG